MKVILKAIEEGAVALLRAPPEFLTESRDPDAREAWISQHLAFRAPSQRQALEMGIKAFLADPKLSSKESPKELEKLICQDILSMQRQPAIMKNYRRYIVVDAMDVNGVRNSYESNGVILQ